jgi:hypothetical protein
VTILINGFALAFLWDGYVGYAQKNARQLVRSLGLNEAVQPIVNPRLTADEARGLTQRIAKGATFETVTTALGNPPLSHGDDAYYLGPGGNLRVHLERGRVESFEWRDGVYTETDQALQRYLGYVLGVVGIGVIVRLVRVLTTRVSLTEAGIKITGKPTIPWEAITALRAANVKSGRCIELDYSIADRRRRIRLDDYVVKDFDAILAATCERAGLPNPYLNETQAEQAG